MLKEASRVSLGAVHTHTHTHTHTQVHLEKIKRVANGATLFDVKNRLCVVLCLGKDVVLEIACFLKIIKTMLRAKLNCITSYTNFKILNELEKQGGVA